MSLEPEFEAWLRRQYPDDEAEWEGATEENIARVEAIAGQPLPRFYRWFLSTLGGDPESLPEVPKVYRACSVDIVLGAYERGELARVGPPFLFIGEIEDPMLTMSFFYDLSRPIRDDAMVMTHYTGMGMSESSETLREWLAWASLLGTRVLKSPQHCSGRLESPSGAVMAQIEPVLATLGFVEVVPHGPFCGAYEREDAALALKVEPEAESDDLLIFVLGGPDAKTLRRLLGTLSTEGEIEVKISKWKPPLPTSA